MKKKEIQARFEFAKEALKTLPDGTTFLLVGSYRRNNRGVQVWEGKVLARLPTTSNLIFDVSDLWRALAGQRSGQVVSTALGVVELFFKVRDSFGKRGRWGVDGVMSLGTQDDLETLQGMCSTLSTTVTHDGLSPREPSEPRTSLLVHSPRGTH